MAYGQNWQTEGTGITQQSVGFTVKVSSGGTKALLFQEIQAWDYTNTQMQANWTWIFTPSSGTNIPSGNKLVFFIAPYQPSLNDFEATLKDNKHILFFSI
jgi:hypothetical protein